MEYYSSRGKVLIKILPAILSMMSVFNAGATEYFVDMHRSDDVEVVDGKSRATAFKTIQEAVDQEDATIVTVYPGRYARGDADTVDGFGLAVCVYIDKALTLRSAEGSGNTFIVGAHSSASGGIGDGAVRCISVSSSGVVIEGFTICDGATPALWNSGLKEGRYAGGINGNANLHVNNCVISNCVATRGGAVAYGNYDRCLFTCNKATGSSALGSVGQHGSYRNCVVYKNSGACFGYPGDLMNCAFIENGGTVLSTGYNSSVTAFNCVFSGNGGIGSSYYSYSNCVFDVSQDTVNGKGMSACVYDQTERQFIDPASGDWRVCRGSAAATAGDASHFPEVTFDGRPFVDWLGTEVTQTTGSVCAGPCQAVRSPTAQVSVSVTRGGGISVEGAVEGGNTIAIGGVVTVTAVETNRLFIGWRVNGVMTQDSGMTYSYTVTGLEEEPVSVEAVYSDAWYVDAVNGSDEENDGCTPETPKKTLAAILSVPGLMAGEVVHAAPGEYDAGAMSHSASNTVMSRACVPKDVTLLADDGPECTFIIGSDATDDVADGYGLGSNAVRCVMLNIGSKVVGFTLTGGRTDKATHDDNDDETASAVLGSSQISSVAENCIITGNVAYSASCTACHLVNCRIYDNHATYRRAVGYNLELSGCIVDRNTGFYPLEYFYGVNNCTIGSDNSRPILYYRRTFNASKPTVVNTLVLDSSSGSVMNDVAASNSVFAEGCGVNTELLTGCIVTNLEALQVDVDYVPVIGANVAVDAGDPGLFDSDICGDNDLYGRQRVANGRMDIGAVEAPWLDRYSDDLAGLGITVTNASPAVVETEDRSVSVPDGRVDIEWRNAGGRAFLHAIPVRVTGTGTLTVSLNGETLGTVTAADGDTVLEFRNALAVNGLSFVYVPGEDDSGAAVIGRLKRLIGHVMVIR